MLLTYVATIPENIVIHKTILFEKTDKTSIDDDSIFESGITGFQHARVLTLAFLTVTILRPNIFTVDTT
jgi:hypothetical protein